MPAKSPKNNRSRIKQLFETLCRDVLASIEAGEPMSPPSGPLTDSLAMRNGLCLHAAAARSFFANVDKAAEYANRDPFWSKQSIDNLFVKHLAAVVDDKQGDCDVRTESSKVLKALEAPPKTFNRKLSVFGFDAGMEGFEFGLMRLERETYTPPVDFGPLLRAGEPVEFLCAHISVLAIDEDSAAFRSEKLLQRHLAVLNALFSTGVRSLTWLNHKRVDPYDISLTGQMSESGEWAVGLGSSRVWLPVNRSDVNRFYELRAGSRISGLLRTEHEISDRIITAFELAGNACVERTDQTAFLLFAVALESAVLGPGKEGELAHQLAVRIAHLLCFGAAEKRETYRTMKRLYKVRSEIVHQGSQEVTQADLEQIRLLCLKCLLTLCASPETRAFTRNEELEDWFLGKLLESRPGTQD